MSATKTFLPRRQFLKTAALASAGAALPGCAALDRLFMGQSGDLSDRTVILGGGYAGLCAAYELRKRGKSYRLFEGSARVGGRAWTLQSLTPASQSGEIGFEWFSQDQTFFWDLAKELKLEIIEVKNQRQNLFLQTGGGVLTKLPEKDLRHLRDLGRRREGLVGERSKWALQRQVWKDNFMGEKPRAVQEWAQLQSRDPAWMDLVQAWCALHFGASPEQIHAWAFANPFLFSENPADLWSSGRFKFRGGSSSLADALLDRVMGAIPGDRLLMSHRLTKVEKLTEGFELTFETPEGRRRYKAGQVICTLPWSVLKYIEGFEKFEGSAQILAPQLSGQAKAVLSFRERFWRKKWDQGRVLASPLVWESTYRSQDFIENSWGLLSVTWSGIAADKAGPHLVKNWIDEAQAIEKRPDLPLVETHLHDWARHPWSLGSRSFPGLEQHEKVFEKPQAGWIWAGDHCLQDNMGTAGGALLSGARAASLVRG
jgi:monoamine oxidase